MSQGIRRPTPGRGAPRWFVAAGVLATAGLLGLAWQLHTRSTHLRHAGPFMPAYPETPARRVFDTELATLDDALDSLGEQVAHGTTSSAQAAFHRARQAYKRTEGLLAYYGPSVASSLNGPIADDESDDALPQRFGAPAAFQQVEEKVFPQLRNRDRASVRIECLRMRDAVRKLRALVTAFSVTPDVVIETGRLEIARLSTLDLAGFDSERTDDALTDAAFAFDGVQAALRGSFTGKAAPVAEQADTLLGRAAAYLRLHPDFNGMDRLAFITEYANPAARAVFALRAVSGLSVPVLRRAWRSDKATVFDERAFDPSAYATDYARQGTALLVSLGGALFGDPRLSGPGTRSCATCHEPTHAFTNGQPRAPALGRGNAVLRHVPTLLNASLQPVLFADERATSLEQQIGTVLGSRDEMGGSDRVAATHIQRDPVYRIAFANAFRVPIDQAVTGRTVRLALAAYVRSLTALDSRFDRAVRGDTTALTPLEQSGFTVFMGKGRCGSCHFAPLFNGTMPPMFTSSEPEIIGVPQKPMLQHARIDPDLGRGGFDGAAVHRYAFKVPTLRNVALTAPYMHNGAYRTLDQVLDFYDAGGGAGVGAMLSTATLAEHPLHLSQSERAALLAFLRSLTDTTSLKPAASATHFATR